MSSMPICRHWYTYDGKHWEPASDRLRSPLILMASHFIDFPFLMCDPFVDAAAIWSVKTKQARLKTSQWIGVLMN